MGPFYRPMGAPQPIGGLRRRSPSSLPPSLLAGSFLRLLEEVDGDEERRRSSWVPSAEDEEPRESSSLSTAPSLPPRVWFNGSGALALGPDGETGMERRLPCPPCGVPEALEG